MSQNIHFYKTKAFLEEVPPNFPKESVYESIKSLFKGCDSHAAEYIDRYFELINIDSINISYSAIQKINPDFSKKLNCIFDPADSQFFMIDPEIWSTLEKIVEKLIMDNFDPKKGVKPTDRLKKNYEISLEYGRLLELFKKNLLFGNIF